MKYKLKEICSITKGATGIMKAAGGKYPLVALSNTRRSHNEFQFDANAVIVPLISSTGHGHASMKRVHYQEGKFALGNILCAVIPKDEKQLNAKYLHLYLQQFKETLLVSLMKGAANVSLPMNKLADVEIEVPGFERQLEIIALEDKAAELKNELEEKLFLQDGDVTKLHQSFLREAMQGKLLSESELAGLKDEQDYETGQQLLERIKKEKNLTNHKIKKPLIPTIKDEEIPFDIPENWQWCKLGEITLAANNGLYKHESFYKDSGFISLRMFNIQEGKIVTEKVRRVVLDEKELRTYLLEKNDILVNRVNSIDLVGKSAIVKEIGEPLVYESMNMRLRLAFKNEMAGFVNYLLLEKRVRDYFYSSAKIANGQVSINQTQLFELLIPLPPIPEQSRIVKKLTELMKLCDELQASIQASKTENEKFIARCIEGCFKK